MVGSVLATIVSDRLYGCAHRFRDPESCLQSDRTSRENVVQAAKCNMAISRSSEYRVEIRLCLQLCPDTKAPTHLYVMFGPADYNGKGSGPFTSRRDSLLPLG